MHTLGTGVTSTTVLTGKTGISLAKYHTSEVYADFYKPNGMEDFIGIFVEPDLNRRRLAALGASAMLTAYRSRYGTELFGDKGVVMMRLLHPALLAGIEIMHVLAHQRASLERTLDLMQEAAWLCTAGGGLLHQNEAMSRLLAADPEQERLKAALSSGARLLARMARGPSKHDSEGTPPGELPAIRTRQARYRVRGSLLEARGTAQAPGMIVVLERLSPEVPSSEALQERFGLTRQEARVALLLADRRRNDEIAEQLSISPNTARRHTDSVLFKLGIHSRDEVAVLIYRS